MITLIWNLLYCHLLTSVFWPLKIIKSSNFFVFCFWRTTNSTQPYLMEELQDLCLQTLLSLLQMPQSSDRDDLLHSRVLLSCYAFPILYSTLQLEDTTVIGDHPSFQTTFSVFSAHWIWLTAVNVSPSWGTTPFTDLILGMLYGSLSKGVYSYIIKV